MAAISSGALTTGRWARLDARAADAVLCLLLAGLAQATVWLGRGFPGPAWLNAVFGLAGTVPLLWRRRRPVAVLAAVVGVVAVQALALGAVESAGVLLPLLAAVYAAAVYGDPAYVVASLGLLGIVVHDLRDPSITSLGDAVFSPLVVGSVFVLGRIVSDRHKRAFAAEQRAARAEDDRAQQVLAAVVEERRRIGRELHDVVAHSISVMALHAGAAESALDRAPDQTREALRIIRQTGQDAVREMGRLLALDAAGGPEDREPLPSLRTIPTLIERVRGAGLDTELIIVGQPRPLPAGLELTLFRIAQEALTNALKHAPRARSPLQIRYRQHSVEIQVSSVGETARSGSAPGTGRGLVGVAQRVHVAGGQFDAGPVEQGWQLRAVLPTGP